MRNVRLQRQRELSTFRRMSIGTWATASEAQVHGTLEIRMERALAYIDRYREATGKRLTVTHLVARAAAQALVVVPEANAILRFGRLYSREQIDIFLQVALVREEAGKADLTGVTIRDADRKSLAEIVDETEAQVLAARKGDDTAVERTRGLFRWLPLWSIGPFLRFLSFAMYTLNVRLPGTPRDPFGSMMITNVGTLGLDVAYAPLVPYSRVPIVLAVGAVIDAPVVEAGAVVAGKLMRLNATFDHRLFDGYQASVMGRTVREWLEDPEGHFEAPRAPR